MSEQVIKTSRIITHIFMVCVYRGISWVSLEYCWWVPFEENIFQPVTFFQYFFVRAFFLTPFRIYYFLMEYFVHINLQVCVVRHVKINYNVLKNNKKKEFTQQWIITIFVCVRQGVSSKRDSAGLLHSFSLNDTPGTLI